MSTIQTLQTEWKVLNQATETVSAGRVGQTPRIYSSTGATTTLTVNLPVLAFGTPGETWATSAANPAKWPTSVAKRITLEANNNVRLRFLVSDSNNDQVTATIWGNSPNGAFNYCVLNPIQSGTAICNELNGVGSLIHLPFTSGGTAEIVAGDTITGGTTSHTATVERVCLQSGTWAAGSAAGVLYITSPSNTFQAAEEVDTANQDDVATITTVVSYFRYADTITVATDHCSAEVEGTSEGDGILELRFDVLGVTDLFCDFDQNVGDGTDGTDMICLYKIL